MKMVRMIRETVGRLFPDGLGSGIATGVLAGFAAQFTGF